MNEQGNAFVRGEKTTDAGNEEIQELIRARIENLRPKLLDLSRRNPLISTRFSPRSNSHIRVVDELPDVLSFNLSNEQAMRFVPLPRLEEDPRDEQTREFQGALANARLIDEIYLAAVDEIDPYSENALEQNRQLERELRDRVREFLDMPPRQASTDVSLPQHAKNNGISPSYELPEPAEEHEDGRHTDTDIQTLLLPDDLERKMNALMAKYRTWVQETGINVLHAAFGFLEWAEPNGGDSSLAPLVLAAVEIEKVKSREGPEFWVKGSGDGIETNMVLAEKLRLDFGVDMPKFEGGSIEDYLMEVAELSPKSLNWKVRRQVAFGVFPSARMAMYYDLDTKENSFEQNEVVSKLFGGSSTGGSTPFADEYDVDHPDVEKKVPCLVLDADSSQFSAMVDVADGKNLSVEGPPGTGKSQTIVNAIAAALADGKKVLFVAEKMAALDVVKSRLEAIGLGEFILPLQAARSTRELVIQSIRDRVEMSVGGVSSDYQAKIEKFKQTRSELAAYIDAISAQFGRTGFTVYDIIGKSIATDKVLLGKPKALHCPEIHDVEGYDRSRIDVLRDLGKATEKAWRAAEGAAPYWRGHKIRSIDRFSAENVRDLAETAADAYGAAAEARQRLATFDIDPKMEISELEQITATLEALEPILATVDTVLIGQICRKEQLRALTCFLDGCNRFRANQDELSRIYSDATDEEWGNRLRSIQRLCSDHGIDTLDIETLQLQRQEEGDRLALYKEAYESLKPFVEALPESADYSIAMLKKARELVLTTPREILALRNEITADPAASSVIIRAGKQGRGLLERRGKLERVMSVTQDVSTTELTTHAATIRGAGLLRVFSPAFRLAKRTYLALSRRGSFKKEQAAEDIQSLIDWREAERKLLSDQQISTAFGLHFKGVDTEFDLFDRLVSYYEAIERDLPGTTNRNVRKFLKTGDLDLVQSIPEAGEGDRTFIDLGSEIERVETHLCSFDEALERLALLVSGLNSPAKTSVASLSNLADQIDVHFQQKATLDRDEEAKDLLGDRFSGAATDPVGFADDIVAVESILSLQSNSSVVLGLLEAMAVEEARSAIVQVLERDEEAENALKTLSLRTEIDCAHFSADRTHAEIAEYLQAAAKDHDGLYVHSAYAAVCGDLDEKGFDWVASALLQENLPLDNLGAILEALVVRTLAIRVYHQFGTVLSRYPGTKLDERRALLAKLDREIIEMSRNYLRAKVCQAAKPPHGVGVGRKSSWTGLALIHNETSKKQRFIPVRELTRRAGEALLELKPCWMMSPLAVAQYLPKGTLTFDLSIIDEASQMPPEDSVGALARSRQTMVVGDTNQLPPTSFFRKLVDDEDADEDEAVLNESILEMANAAFRPARRLRWHYRSRHSALINFSNHMVYKNDLIVFPSATENRPDMGVFLTPVQGRYRSGTNGEEAAAMIDAALRFMRTSPDRSLGLVTLNQKQRDLLLEAMDYALSRDSIASEYIDRWTERNDGLESFFIKNLENVQGDERDVIFIGTVYGPEEPGGPVMQRFGPINGLAGKRRLNVLFSRAKQQIVTFSSMTAADIKADENGNPGAHMLKRWLEYSATGVLHTGEQTYKEPDSDFEIFVMDQIRAMGCEPVPQVGVAGYFIDIGVKHPHWPHGFIMAVECDGATYHSSRSARDRDRLRQEVLEGLDWFFHRIWSTDWFNDRHKEVEKLRKAIEGRLDYLKKHSPVSVAAVADELASRPPPPESASEITRQPDTKQGTPARGLSKSTTATSDRASVVQSKAPDPNYISVGDKVRVRYLSGTRTTIEVTLSDEINAPDRALVHIGQPLGKALLGAEEGDEIEVLVGSYVRQATIERVTKGNTIKQSHDVGGEKRPIGLAEANARSDGFEAIQRNKADPKNAPLAEFGRPHLSVGGGKVKEESGLFHDSQQSRSLGPKPKLSADRFYEPGYLSVIRVFGAELIDTSGPITFRHLSELVARAHGFRRTGTQIKKQVWAAVSKTRRTTKAPNGETIFWPSSSEPNAVFPFRGLTVGDDARTWRDVPYPEKLGLARSILVHGPHTDAAATMASKIGLGRLRQTTREELKALLKTVDATDNLG